MNFYKKDRHYFLRYFIINALVFGLVDILLMKKIHFDFNFALADLFIALVAIVFGLAMATAFHNASHHNFKNKFLNILIGEFCGFYTLIGMRPFRVGHMLHHIHSDDPELDPHPPTELSFIQFILTSHNQTIEVLKNVYRQNHGASAKTEANIKWQTVFHQMGILFKILFIFIVFGPTLFVSFYVISYLAYFFGFAHLNYISHLPDEDGEIRVKNHSQGFFYQVMNVLTSGGYYHKNHHLNPKLYNPSHYQARAKTSSFQILSTELKV